MLLRVVLLKTGTSQLPDTKQVQTVKPYAPKSGTCSSVSQVTTSQLSDTFSGANTLFLELGFRSLLSLGKAAAGFNYEKQLLKLRTGYVNPPFGHLGIKICMKSAGLYFRDQY